MISLERAHGMILLGYKGNLAIKRLVPLATNMH